MKYINILFPLLLTACGSPYPVQTPVSYLSGPPFYFTGSPGGSDTGNSTLTFDSSGTFIYEANWQVGGGGSSWTDLNCASTGTWQDLNVGSTAGQVTFTYITDTCNINSLAGNSETYSYIFAGNNFAITIVLWNQAVQLSD